MNKTHARSKIQGSMSGLEKNAARQLDEELSVEGPASKIKLLVILLVIVCAAVVTTHWPALSAKALSFDDSEYLTENVLVQNPSWSSAWRFLSEVVRPSSVRGYYQPLAMISLMFDYALGGRQDNLMPFHRTSLALHTANTALVIVFLYLLFGRVWVSAGVGLLFGLHPMTVETIAWVGERKTVLAAFFALWCLVLYLRYARGKERRFYIGCVVMYVLSLLCKPISLPLPVLLLLLDYWPIRRLSRKCVWEKIPLFVVGAVFCCIIFVSQYSAGGVVLPSDYNPVPIVLILCHNIVFYLYKIIWPIALSSHYGFPEPLGLSDPMVLAGVIGSFVLIVLLMISLRWTRGAFTGWLFFFIAILPTMQIIGFSSVIAADKFVYLPSVGLLMILVSFGIWFCGTDWSGKFVVRRVAMIIIVLLLAGAELVATRHYLVHWRNTLSLCEHMLKLRPKAVIVHNMAGIELRSQGRFEDAISHFRRALAIKPDYVRALGNLGVALESQGKVDEAISCYIRAIQIKPKSPLMYYDLGIAHESLGKIDEAIRYYRKALELKPDYYQAHNNLGNVLKSKGKLIEAISHYEAALQIKPNSASIHFNLGIANRLLGDLNQSVYHYRKALQFEPAGAETHYNLANVFESQGKVSDAVDHYRMALKYKPDFVQAHFNLGNVLQSQGRFDESIYHYRKVLEFKTDDAEAHYNLGLVLAMTGEVVETVKHFEEAIRLAPDWPSPLNAAALILATNTDPKLRDANKAVEFAERACKLTKNENASILNTLATAYAATGQFDKALITGQKALALASAGHADELANYIRRQLERYREQAKSQRESVGD